MQDPQKAVIRFIRTSLVKLQDAPIDNLADWGKQFVTEVFEACQQEQKLVFEDRTTPKSGRATMFSQTKSLKSTQKIKLVPEAAQSVQNLETLVQDYKILNQ